jgi:CRISPR/Cas system CSM-associated protein Csm3 (group 7 of RAMP superfamily)
MTMFLSHEDELELSLVFSVSFSFEADEVHDATEDDEEVILTSFMSEEDRRLGMRSSRGMARIGWMENEM